MSLHVGLPGTNWKMNNSNHNKYCGVVESTSRTRWVRSLTPKSMLEIRTLIPFKTTHDIKHLTLSPNLVEP